MIKFPCSHCGQKLGVSSKFVGRGVRCPNCKSPNRVPDPAGEAGRSEPAGQGAAPAPPDDGLGALAAAASGGTDAGGFVLEEAAPPAASTPEEFDTDQGAPPVPATMDEDDDSLAGFDRPSGPPPVGPSSALATGAGSGAAVSRPLKKPGYGLLVIAGWVCTALGGLLLLAGPVVFAIVLFAGASVGAVDGDAADGAAAGGLAGLLVSLPILIGSLVPAALLIAVGQGCLALRDIARNSWFEREAMRHLH